MSEVSKDLKARRIALEVSTAAIEGQELKGFGSGEGQYSDADIPAILAGAEEALRTILTSDTPEDYFAATDILAMDCENSPLRIKYYEKLVDVCRNLQAETGISTTGAETTAPFKSGRAADPREDIHYVGKTTITAMFKEGRGISLICSFEVSGAEDNPAFGPSSYPVATASSLKGLLTAAHTFAAGKDGVKRPCPNSKDIQPVIENSVRAVAHDLITANTSYLPVWARNMALKEWTSLIP